MPARTKHPREGRGYRAKTEEEQTEIKVRLSRDLKDRLYNEADRRLVSANYLSERALETMITKWENENLV